MPEKTEGQASIVDALVKTYEKKISEIQGLDLKRMGFSDSELKAGAEFYSQLEKMLEDCHGDPEAFLTELSNMGIGVFHNSAFLDAHEDPLQALARMTDSGQGSRTGALFATHDILQKQAEDLSGAARIIGVELQEALKFKGAMFLTGSSSIQEMQNSPTIIQHV